MFFYLSKILLFLIKPLVWISILLFGAILTKNDKTRKRRIIITTFILYIFSNNFIVNEILLIYEDNGSTELDSSYEVGLILGGFSKMDTAIGRTVFFEANDRFMQAYRLFKKGQIKKLMISSGNSQIFHHELKEADAVRLYLLEIGVPDSSIIIENQSRNTLENIKFSKAKLDSLKMNQKVLIFTSAWHIPRVRLCLKNQLSSDIYATHFLSDKKRDFSISNMLVPNAGALYNMELLMKEIVGYVFYTFKTL